MALRQERKWFFPEKRQRGLVTFEEGWLISLTGSTRASRVVCGALIKDLRWT